MNQYENPYQAYGTGAVPAANAEVNARAEFIRKTYLNLGLAILGFIACCGIMLGTDIAERIFTVLFGYTQWAIFAFLIGFAVVAGLVNRWAHRAVSIREQYGALTTYVVLESILFAPFLWRIENLVEPQIGPVIGPAAIVTLFIFFGLTAIVVYTAKDFSWLRGFLGIAMMGALGIFAASLLFGFTLGIIFVTAMVVLASGYILYYTSTVMRDYPTTHYVAAALSLFASIALLFWYLLQLVELLQGGD